MRNQELAVPVKDSRCPTPFALRFNSLPMSPGFGAAWSGTTRCPCTSDWMSRGLGAAGISEALGQSKGMVSRCEFIFDQYSRGSWTMLMRVQKDFDNFWGGLWRTLVIYKLHLARSTMWSLRELSVVLGVGVSAGGAKACSSPADCRPPESLFPNSLTGSSTSLQKRMGCLSCAQNSLSADWPCAHEDETLFSLSLGMPLVPFWFLFEGSRSRGEGCKHIFNTQSQECSAGRVLT